MAGAALAQSWPTKPVRLIVPATAGDGSDILARTLAQELGPALGQSLVIENRPGAGGSIAAAEAARAAPDGYTVMLANGSSHAVTPSLYPKLPYDTLRDFAPVTLIALSPNVLVVNAALPPKSAQELVAYAKARPGRMNIASAGQGSISHLAAELFKSAAGVDIVNIPYRGAAPALADVASGEVSAMLINIPSALPLIRAGKVRALATTGTRRAVALADVPTLQEAGIRGAETTAWFALVVPTRTPDTVIRRLQSETAKALAAPTVRERLTAMGADPVGNSPDEFGAFMRAEIAKYAKVIRDAGIRLE